MTGGAALAVGAGPILAVEAERGGWIYRVEKPPGEAVPVVARAPGGGSITSWLIG